MQIKYRVTYPSFLLYRGEKGFYECKKGTPIVLNLYVIFCMKRLWVILLLKIFLFICFCALKLSGIIMGANEIKGDLPKFFTL